VQGALVPAKRHGKSRHDTTISTLNLKERVSAENNAAYERRRARLLLRVAKDRVGAILEALDLLGQVDEDIAREFAHDVEGRLRKATRERWRRKREGTRTRSRKMSGECSLPVKRERQQQIEQLCGGDVTGTYDVGVG
jgi:hypothetical protein